jgi:hypothetical protein
MATYDGYAPSAITDTFLQTAATEIGNHELVIVLNPGTTGTASPGANTASAVLAGLSVDRGPQAPQTHLPELGQAAQNLITCDIGGCTVDLDHTATLTGVEAGARCFVAGPRSVAATGNVLAGRIVKVLATGAGTSRVRVQLNAFAHSDVS